MLEHYQDESGGQVDNLTWTKEVMRIHYDQFDRGILSGSYGRANLENIHRAITEQMDVQGV